MANQNKRTSYSQTAKHFGVNVSAVQYWERKGFDRDWSTQEQEAWRKAYTADRVVEPPLAKPKPDEPKPATSAEPVLDYKEARTQKLAKEINAPASRLKKSCRGAKSSLRSWSSHPVSVFGVCRWKRSELSGRGLNGKTAWVRSGCQIWHRPFNTTIILSGPLFGRRLHGGYLADLFWKAQGSGPKSCQLATLQQCRQRSEIRQLPPKRSRDWRFRRFHRLPRSGIC